jgi:hypothetical protein
MEVGMAPKIRSPRYPAISLREAIEKARAVYENDGRNKIRKELVAEHMGYHSLNGASLGVISAVVKYGLIEGGLAAMNITARAINIFEREQGDPERAQAIRDAAFEPEQFKEIAAAYPDRASDAAIRSHLITKLGFLPEAASNFVRSYRETMQLVETETQAGEAPSLGLDPVADQSAAVTETSDATGTSGLDATVRSTAGSVKFGSGERELTTGMLSRAATFRLIVNGHVGVKEIERLIRKLELDKEILADVDSEPSCEELLS